MALKPKQAAFVREYLIDLNATAAYRRAGYATKTAAATEAAASRLLRNVTVAAAIQQAMAERAQRTEITADRTLKELAFVAFSDLGELIEFTADGFRFKDAGNISEAARRSVAAVKVRQEQGDENRPAAQVVEFKLWPKVEALAKLAQHLGLLKDVHEHRGPGGGPIQHEHAIADQSRDNFARFVAALRDRGRVGAGGGGPGGNGHVAPLDSATGPTNGSVHE